MRRLIIGCFLTYFSIGQSYADYKVIGETKDCQIHTTVIQKVTATEDYLLVLHKKDTYKLKLEDKVGSMKYYTSLPIDGDLNKTMTFDATIMREEMSVLSRLTIYLSGIKLECPIDMQL